MDLFTSGARALRAAIPVAVPVAVPLVALLHASTALAQDCFSFTDAWPLDPGNQWVYADGPGALGQTLTVSSGLTTIDGAATRAVRTSLGVTTYVANDASGLRIYRRTGRLQGVDVVSTYRPRIARAGASACVGDSQADSGTANVEASGIGSVEATYSAVSTVEARETITVEAGTFDTYRVKWRTRLQATVDGDAIDDTVTEVNWFAPGVGPVRQTITQGSASTTLGLRSTNITPPSSQLSLRFVDGGTPPTAGRRHVWRAIIFNAGPDTASNVTLVVDAPAGSTVNGGSSRSGWACTHTAAQARCTIARLPARQSSTQVDLDTIAPLNGTNATVSGSLSASTTDPRPDDNQASLSLVLVGGTPPPPDPSTMSGVLVIINTLLGE